jgi:hypothetical protein
MSDQEVVMCGICALDNRKTPAVRLVVETGGGVCQGHVVPTLLAGYGVTAIDLSTKDGSIRL